MGGGGVLIASAQPHPQVSSLAQEGEEVSGQARCPFDAKQSIVALFVGGCWTGAGDRHWGTLGGGQG